MPDDLTARCEAVLLGKAARFIDHDTGIVYVRVQGAAAAMARAIEAALLCDEFLSTMREGEDIALAAAREEPHE